MPVKTDIWVSSYLKRCNLAGLMGVVVKKGAAEAGTVFVCVRRADDQVKLLGPPAGPAFDEIGERRFEHRFEEPVHQKQVDDYLKRQLEFDPDIWILEVEDRKGSGLLDGSCSA